MKLLDTPELNRLLGYMDALRHSLNGCNYVTWFDAKELKLEDGDFEIETLVKFAYPKAKPDKATILECSSLEMVESINNFIARINPYDKDKNLAENKKRNLITGFWKNLSKCIDYKNAKIFQYNPAFDANDQLQDFIIWGFTFLALAREQQLCLLIHGGAAD